MKLIKENKIAVLSIGAIILVFALFAVPGFAHYMPMGDSYNYYFNGYEFIFNLKVLSEGSGTKIGSGTVGAGIAIIVLLGLAGVAGCLSKKSSFFVLLSGLFNLVNSILFFSMEASAHKVYQSYDQGTTCGWVTYFLGAVLLIIAAYTIYVAVNMMKDEIKHPTQSKGPNYNYLKK